ncbi:hypothetical protein PM082_024310 [Marasmius tenuissimus]|nr:hypothetical protein PM082_024310 [Marasmius tenuissimus]
MPSPIRNRMAGDVYKKCISRSSSFVKRQKYLKRRAPFYFATELPGSVPRQLQVDPGSANERRVSELRVWNSATLIDDRTASNQKSKAGNIAGGTGLTASCVKTRSKDNQLEKRKGVHTHDKCDRGRRVFTMA